MNKTDHDFPYLVSLFTAWFLEFSSGGIQRKAYNNIIKYKIKVITDSNLNLSFISYIDGNVKNEDSNYDEIFWNIKDCRNFTKGSYLEATTKKTDFTVGIAAKYNLCINGKSLDFIIDNDILTDT